MNRSHPPDRRGVSAEPPGDDASAEKRGRPGDHAASPAMVRVRDQVLADEAEDLAAARAGDEEAFARLYDRFAPVVLSLCRGRCRYEAEDATQETFIRAHRKLQDVRDPAGLRPWLFAIARRVCSERRRAAQRRSRHEEGAAVTRTAELHAAGGTNPGPATVERTEQLGRLEQALARLDDRERLAIHLYYLETDPVAAAASALSLSRSGYYKLLARAREQLANLMKERQPA